MHGDTNNLDNKMQRELKNKLVKDLSDDLKEKKLKGNTHTHTDISHKWS